jgi:hypothetical protein
MVSYVRSTRLLDARCGLRLPAGGRVGDGGNSGDGGGGRRMDMAHDGSPGRFRSHGVDLRLEDAPRSCARGRFALRSSPSFTQEPGVDGFPGFSSPRTQLFSGTDVAHASVPRALSKRHVQHAVAHVIGLGAQHDENQILDDRPDRRPRQHLDNAGPSRAAHSSTVGSSAPASAASITVRASRFDTRRIIARKMW